MTTRPLRALVVDDEPHARARLKALCTASSELVTVVGEAATGMEALDSIAANAPDLVLLDIAMPDGDGLTVADAVTRMSAPPAVIFCTAYSAHALRAFDVAAVDYLLKPVGRDRFTRAIQRAAVLRAGSPPATGRPPWLDHLWVPYREAMVRIAMRDVERIEAEGDYVRLVSGELSYLLHETMASLEAKLDPKCFVRVRRSMIVRIDLLAAAEHMGAGVWKVSLSDGTEVRAGPTYWKAVKALLR